jgi:O-antigen/teichoic acid export membrane protein
MAFRDKLKLERAGPQRVNKSEKIDPAGISARVKGAVIWRSGSQIVAQLISWGSTLFVIRILDPSDYGLFAMTQVILVFLTFLSGYGFASSLIQSETIEPIRIRQAFGMLLLLNSALALTQLAIAPVVADYYGQPLIADLLRWQSLLYLANPFMVIPDVLMSRRLEFMRPAIITIISTALGAACAITLALSGAGVWTLVVAPIVIFWARAIGLVIATGFLVMPSFNFRGAGQMFGFGTALLVSQGFWVIQSQADIFIAGRVLDPHTLGLYAEALFLTQIFASRFVPPLNEVAFPAYARIQKDRRRLAGSFLTAVRLIMALALPLYLGLAVTAAPVVETLFGPKWVEMAPLVSILALAMPVLTAQILFAPALNALGKPQLTARNAACGAILMPATFLVGVQFGAMGLAVGWLVAVPLLAAFTYSNARQHIGIDLAGLGRQIMPSLLAAMIMASLVWLLKSALPPMPAPALLAILATAGAACYAALLLIIAPQLCQEALRLVVGRKPAEQPSA